MVLKSFSQMDNLTDTLTALGRKDLVPRRIRIPTEKEITNKKKFELLMKKKEDLDDEIYKANNFLTPREMPEMPSSYFF